MTGKEEWSPSPPTPSRGAILVGLVLFMILARILGTPTIPLGAKMNMAAIIAGIYVTVAFFEVIAKRKEVTTT